MGGADKAERGEYTSLKGNETWEYMATIACSLLMLCIGSAMGWNSPSSVKLMEPDSPVKITASDLSSLMSLMAIGQFVAPPLNSIIVDRIGRKNTILFVGPLLIVAWLPVTMTHSVMILYVARLAAGLSLGIGFSVCSMYLGEIASTSTRSMSSSLMLIMYNLGILIAFIFVPSLSIVANAWLNLALVVSFMLVFSFMPESPIYLAMAERTDEAEEVLMLLRGRTDVSEEMKEIQKQLRNSKKMQEGQSRFSLGAIFTDKASRMAIFIIGLFSVTHHFGGNVPVLTYGQKIFRDLKIQVISDHAANVINGVVQLVSICLVAPLPNKWGRRPLVAISGAMAGFCNLVVGVYFYLQEYTEFKVEGYSWIPMIAIFLVIFAFNCGLQTVQNILIMEMFAPEFKALGVCVVIMNGGWMYVISSKLYLMVSDTWHLGHSPPFLFFVVVVWSVTGLLMWLTPETKGKTLLEIQEALLK
ncbi:sugar transporter ERD6-like 6 [Copidosoma floridanum]|uniref:sugar transporter ERD6-like 6 n=1 Tax=Copidosoma floridanum TaxID=29053 RepID=UPI0006C97EB0|nr:sugar transporter ERD6-like 6 [Copidosoma floridanum]